METHIFDLDGTLVKYHTNEWLPGALEHLKELSDRGDYILIITMRGPQDDDKEWSIDKTIETVIYDLQEQGIAHDIIMNVPSPRHLYDDNDIFAHKRKTDQSWK